MQTPPGAPSPLAPSTLFNAGRLSDNPEETLESRQRYDRILSVTCYLGVAGGSVGILLFLRPFFAAWPAYASGGLVAWSLLALWLLRRGHSRAARRILAAGAFIELIILTVASAPGSGVEMFWLLLLALQFIFPYSERKFAIVLGGLSALGFLFFAASGLRGYGLSGAVSPTELRIAQITNTGMVGILAFVFVTLAMQANMRFERELHHERRRSETMLRAILPESIIRRLKAEETFIAERLENTAVLFADLSGFTELAARETPENLARLLNQIFSAFDEIAQRHGVERIKTIGDNYMACAGAPNPSPDAAAQIAAFALNIQEYMRANFGDRLTLRIGAHFGPVVAGVLGAAKFSYDLWGDTVNVASRFESHGEAGRIHVTEEFFAQCRGRFQFEDRGSLAIKGKGQMRGYWLIE